MVGREKFGESLNLLSSSALQEEVTRGLLHCLANIIATIYHHSPTFQIFLCGQNVLTSTPSEVMDFVKNI